MARKGRGQLSAIERLPEECTPVIAWAATELQDRNRTQTEIYQEFFKRLQQLQSDHHGELEFTIPSFSAFNRYSIKLAIMTRRIDQTREIAATISERIDAEASDDLTLIAAEAIKTLVFEILTNAGESGVDPKGAMALASALHKATQAQNVSTARRLKVQQEFAEKVEETVDTVAKVAGLTKERAAEIRKQVLGLQT